MAAERFLAYDAENYYKKRDWLLGEGRCGGKAKGLAFAHTVLFESDLVKKVELPALSHVVSTEIFEDFLNANGLSDLYDVEDWAVVRERFAGGVFSEALKRDLERMLRDFESLENPPLVIRSSALMEDSVDLAFAGKYDSFFSAKLAANLIW